MGQHVKYQWTLPFITRVSIGVMIIWAYYWAAIPSRSLQIHCDSGVSQRLSQSLTIVSWDLSSTLSLQSPQSEIEHALIKLDAQMPSLNAVHLQSVPSHARPMIAQWLQKKGVGCLIWQPTWTTPRFPLFIGQPEAEQGMLSWVATKVKNVDELELSSLAYWWPMRLIQPKPVALSLTIEGVVNDKNSALTLINARVPSPWPKQRVLPLSINALYEWVEQRKGATVIAGSLNIPPPVLQGPPQYMSEYRDEACIQSYRAPPVRGRLSNDFFFDHRSPWVLSPSAMTSEIMIGTWRPLRVNGRPLNLGESQLAVVLSDPQIQTESYEDHFPAHGWGCTSTWKRIDHVLSRGLIPKAESFNLTQIWLGQRAPLIVEFY